MYSSKCLGTVFWKLLQVYGIPSTSSCAFLEGCQTLYRFVEHEFTERYYPLSTFYWVTYCILLGSSYCLLLHLTFPPLHFNKLGLQVLYLFCFALLLQQIQYTRFTFVYLLLNTFVYFLVPMLVCLNPAVISTVVADYLV